MPSNLYGTGALQDANSKIDQYQNSYNGYNGSYKKSQQQGNFRGGLVSDFSQYAPNGTGDSAARWSDIVNDPDADVSNAAQSYYHLTNPDEGTNRNEQAALYNMYKGRIGTKNSLAEQIAGNAGQEQTQEDIYRLSAGQALGQGLKNTRENYNSRGLLYSGKRQGGENQVRGAVAGQLASGLSGTKREFSNSKSAAENAYASVDLANAQESLQLAHQAYDTANANNIARLQAMQQLGTGVGHAAGMIAGSYSGSNYGSATPAGREFTQSPGAGRQQLMSGGF